MKTEQQIVQAKIMSELKELDKEKVEIGEGIHMKPSQCYRFSFQPPHLLFNTNCPEALKEKIMAIFQKYFSESIKQL